MNVDLSGLPDGHLAARIEELNECIRTDERHINYLREEKEKYWVEQAKRQLKRKCPGCGSTELQAAALFDEGGNIDCFICKCGQVVPLGP